MAHHVRALRFVAASALAFSALGCTGSATPSAPASSPPAAVDSDAPVGSGVRARVVHSDDALRTPSFVWLDSSAMTLRPGATPVDVAEGTLRAVAPSLHLDERVLDSAHIREVHDIGRGAIVTRFAQTHEGVEVFRSSLAIAMRRDLTPVSLSGALAPSLKVLARGGWTLDARDAIARAFAKQTGLQVTPVGVRANGSDAAGYERYLFSVAAPHDDAGAYYGSARAKRVWFPQASGLVPAWYVDLGLGREGSTNASARGYVIHAGSGAALFDNNHVAADAYSYRVWADNSGPRGLAPLEAPYGHVLSPNRTAAPDPAAVEPAFLASSLVTLANVPFKRNDPWLLPGATQLSGNNVVAYADLAAPDGYQPSSADRTVAATAPGVFGNIYDASTLPSVDPVHIDAATTNLFFIVNYMHDLFYDSGYDEASGNSQVDNFGRGGVGGDPVHAESQDYGGLNNANCQTPPDGSPVIIQMYLWTSTSLKTVVVDAPASVAGALSPVGAAAFGNHATGWNVSNDVALYLDSGATTSIACTAPSNGAALAGKIALLDRGSCDFITKARNAKAAGAVGVLIANNDNPMLGSFGSAEPDLVDFNGMLITKADGAKLKGALADGVHATYAVGPPGRDGSIDGNIVSHEWGHSLSNRLIGNGDGLDNNQGGGMGEGWSDFVGLLTYVRKSDLGVSANANWGGSFPVATYAPGNTPDVLWAGIRRYPYSIDLTKNPLTFKHIAEGEPLPDGSDGTGNSEVHNTGEIWANMLWGCYVGLLRDTAHYDFDSAGQAMRDYLVASLKLTPHSPTFVEARDAWFAAALANSSKPDDLVTFANAFAHRGLGTGAVAPPKTAGDNVGVTESFVTGKNVDVTDVSFAEATSCDNDGILDVGETAKLKVTLRNSGIAALPSVKVKIGTKQAGVSFPDGAEKTVSDLGVLKSTTVELTVRLDSGTGLVTIPVEVDLEAADLQPTAGPRVYPLTYFGNYDFQPAASASDDVDAPTTLWTASHDPALANADWARAETATVFGKHWVGIDTPSASDIYLTSPPLKVGAGPFGFTFAHAWNLEGDAGAGEFYDGAVLELSTDDGKTWIDLGDKITANGYVGNIIADPAGQFHSPLTGRPVWSGKSPEFPKPVVTKVELGTAYANKTVLVRFRVGTDAGAAASGWYVDDIAFTGLADTPFAKRIEQTKSCAAAAPVANITGTLTVDEGKMGQLDGSSSTVAPGKTATYQWTQTTGIAVKLSSTDGASVSYTAPNVSADMKLTFQLVVSDGTLTSAPATFTVTVKDVKKGGGHGCDATGTAPATTALPLVALLLLALALRRRRA
jgi:uncharacterized protein (TIGR03382 family)